MAVISQESRGYIVPYRVTWALTASFQDLHDQWGDPNNGQAERAKQHKYDTILNIWIIFHLLYFQVHLYSLIPYR